MFWKSFPFLPQSSKKSSMDNLIDALASQLQGVEPLPRITASQKLLFLRYLTELQNWNDKVRLTADPAPERLIHVHLFDSLQFGRLIHPTGSLTDIGSGGGFPGIPLKILYPDLQVVLIESRRKRANFLRHITRVLKFEQTAVLEGRGEEVALPFPSGCDQVVFRGFSELATNLSVGERHLKSGGIVVVQKDRGEFVPGVTPLPSGWIADKDIPFTGIDSKESCILSFKKQDLALFHVKQ